jgi:hypothetical protein
MSTQIIWKRWIVLAENSTILDPEDQFVLGIEPERIVELAGHIEY